MKKNILSLLLLAGMFSAANAQTYKGRVGVNTTTPASTMDIVGDPADDKVTDGLIAPRLSGDELKAKDALYTSAQTGALVYAKAAVGTASPKTANVTSAGYYWFDGSVWVKAGGAAAAAAGTPFKLQSDDTDAQSDKTNQIYRDGYVQVGVTSTNKATANSNYKTTALTAYANTTDMDATAAANQNVTGTYSASINPAGKTAGAVYGAANIAESRGTTDYITGTVSRANLHGTATMPQAWNQIIGHMINAGQTTASRIGGVIYGTSTIVNGGAGAWGLFGSANYVTTSSADNGTSDAMIGYKTSIQPGGSATYNEVVGVKALVSNSGTGIIANHIGGDFTAAEKNTTTVTTQPLVIGVKASAEISNLAKTKVTNMYGLKAESNFKTAAAANTITNNYGGHFSINSPAGLSSTNAYGVYIGAIEGAGNSYGVYSVVLHGMYLEVRCMRQVGLQLLMRG